MSWRRFLAVLKARNREFVRDRAALGWNIIFPILIVAGFAFAFSGKPMDLYKVSVYAADPVQKLAEVQKTQAFFRTDYIRFIPVSTLAPAITKVERHQLDMLFDLDQHHYWVNRDSPKGYMLERVLHGSDTVEAPAGGFQRQTVSGREIRYVDWLIPGILAMNMMFSALFGVGYVIVRYRKSGVLKRLQATPLTAFEFLSAQVVSRLWLILAITSGVYAGANLFIDFSMFGSYTLLLLVFALGAVSLISLGLLVAARIASEELAGGILNVLSWPMMFLSGVWFSLEGTNPLIQKLALLFPLTHIIDASRAIMIDGAGLAGISTQLMVLTLMSGVFLLLGAALFRWK
ncbi:MAG TPA: ABC transporter permease [Chromatiales bacterium]|nr:ABC transporter permease [Chromatiales bacterium]HEX23117.1 ABC transporter permease [Chromatiales bacterium]